MPKSEPQYVLYEIPLASQPSDNGALSTSLLSASLPFPSWLCGNATLTGSGVFVIYYSAYFSEPTASSALFQNEFEVPATRVSGNQNHGYIVLSTSGNIKTKISLRATPTVVLHGKILITELSFHDEDSVVK
ncbi:MAG: hypothetical protein E7471_04875 [Ruminococcaceae bacterium]|nr:hypothetical protein [Oscillospiraceae bacterium]